jgi:hypothetical protein
MFDFWNTQKTFIVKTPKGVHQWNKLDATASWTDASQKSESCLESGLDVRAVNQARVWMGPERNWKVHGRNRSYRLNMMSWS